MNRFLLIVFSFLFLNTGQAQMVVRTIHSFGAKGDGTANDHNAFMAAAEFFNKRGGNGILRIPAGTYLVGRQIINQTDPLRARWHGLDVLSFKAVKNMTISADSGAVIKYVNGLRFGTFEPRTGNPRQGDANFFDNRSAANIGNCIYFENSENILIEGIEIDGNSSNVFLGGYYGGIGRQLRHDGIHIKNSRKVTVQNVFVHHMSLDGICIANEKSDIPDAIRLLGSRFNYNGRQGLSWIGGNDLYAQNCQFNHTGKGRFHSAPASGVDVEAEVGPVRNGLFEHCEFVDNEGVCMVAESGDGADVTFNHCLFWSSTTWSIWVNKPGFTFNHCTVYGPVVHGYDANNEREATKFYDCVFEDKPYHGKHPPEPFLINTNDRRRMRFENCQFTVNYKKLFWISGPNRPRAEENYQLINNNFVHNHTLHNNGDFVFVMRGVFYRNNNFWFSNRYFTEGCCSDTRINMDGGGNSFHRWEGGGSR